MLDQYDKVSDAVGFIAARWPEKPAVGIVLGSGLGGIG